MADLVGKHAVVTGAARGIGAAIAEELGRRGATVVVADINTDLGEATAARIVEAGGAAIFQYCDVTVEDDIVAAIDASVGVFGGFNVMHNNAGIGAGADLLSTSNELWDRVMAVNVRGTFWGSKHAVQKMLDLGGGGAIVNTASMVSFTADPNLLAYTASKHAVLGLTRAVGAGYAKAGIRCTCVCPGDIDTDLVRDWIDSQDDPARARAELHAKYPANRIADPHEVARAAVFLASDEASWVNATALSVDGGVLATPY